MEVQVVWPSCMQVSSVRCLWHMNGHNKLQTLFILQLVHQSTMAPKKIPPKPNHSSKSKAPTKKKEVDPHLLLTEVVGWGRYKQLVCCLSKMFEPHLDAYQSTMSFNDDVAFDYIYNEVFEKIHFEFLTVAIFLVERFLVLEEGRMSNHLPPPKVHIPPKVIPGLKEKVEPLTEFVQMWTRRRNSLSNGSI